jgi:hypothetical protein
MPPKVKKAKATQAKHAKSGSGGSSSSAPNRLLVALLELHVIGTEAPSREMVGTHAGVRADSSTMRNACAGFKKNGLVDTPDSKSLKLTTKGHAAASKLTNVRIPKSNAEFHGQFKAMLQSGGKKTLQIFDILVSGPPRSRAELAKIIGTEVKKSTFRNALAPFNKLKFLEELADKRLQLADKCFPLGRDHDNVKVPSVSDIASAVSPDRQVGHGVKNSAEEEDSESQFEDEAVDSVKDSAEEEDSESQFEDEAVDSVKDSAKEEDSESEFEDEAGDSSGDSSYDYDN